MGKHRGILRAFALASEGNLGLSLWRSYSPGGHLDTYMETFSMPWALAPAMPAMMDLQQLFWVVRLRPGLREIGPLMQEPWL